MHQPKSLIQQLQSRIDIRCNKIASFEKYARERKMSSDIGCAMRVKLVANKLAKEQKLDKMLLRELYDYEFMKAELRKHYAYDEEYHELD